MLNQIASALGRNDEVPNIELAEKLAREKNEAGIAEIVSGLTMKKAVSNDCIKVLYEIGKQNPTLIMPYANVFLALLKSKNNRIVWGAMTALGQITALAPEVVFAGLDDVLAAYENGSVITIDHSISVFASLCGAGEKYAEKVLSILIHHLENCRSKEIPQHLERMAVCFTPDNIEQFKLILQTRYDELTKPQQARVNKVMKRFGGSKSG